jgi:hypothetical protein
MDGVMGVIDEDTGCCCFGASWRRRYFALQDGILSSYNKEDDLLSKWDLDVSNAGIVLVSAPKVNRSHCVEGRDPTHQSSCQQSS